MTLLLFYFLHLLDFALELVLLKFHLLLFLLLHPHIIIGLHIQKIIILKIRLDLYDCPTCFFQIAFFLTNKTIQDKETKINCIINIISHTTSKLIFNTKFSPMNFMFLIIFCQSYMQRGFDKPFCQQFQSQLTYNKIDNIWKNFREAGNSIEGRITKLNFKKIMNKYGIKNEKFLDRLFERFKLDKSSQKSQKQEIDLQDFVIGLAVLSRLTFLDKIKFIFYLTDLDQDGCLSLEQIENMIERIERIFCKENSSAKVDSYSLLFDLAHKKANRNYNQLMVLLKRNNKELKNDEGGLITSDQFMEALKQSRDLCKQQKFIPLNLSLSEIIENIACEPSIKISQNVKKTFVQFRQELGSIMQQTKNQKDNIIKYPGKIDIMKNDKVVETLPNIEKNLDKRLQKNNNKNKIINSMRNNDIRQQNQQKSAQQNLQTYKLKVKKMIQTKQDPRLNVRFDQMYKKS